MQKIAKFQLEEAVEIPKWIDSYPEHKFAVFKCCFLSTKENSHKLNISSNVLKECAKTILGNFLVAKIDYRDATTHKDSEVIYGYFPKEQEIEFVNDGEYLKAYAYSVVSKRYSKELNGIFEFDNLRNSSVEMTVETPEYDENDVLSFDIYGLTVLGKTVNGSCPDADVKMVRFSEEEATEYYSEWTSSITKLQKFVEERNNNTAKFYKIDKSKESLSSKPWGDVDKEDLRNKIMAAKNRNALVNACYMIVEKGWEDAPSQHLKYPVMNFEGDKLVYNRYGLASALAYAKQEKETSVISKLEKIYKTLDLDADNRKEGNNMENIEKEENSVEMSEVLENTVEQNEEFSEEKENSEERFAEDTEEKQEEKEEDDKDEDVKMSEDEMMAKIEELSNCVQEKENIIMGKDEEMSKMNAELEELRKFKCAVEEKEKSMAVEQVLSEMTSFMDKDTIDNFREESKAISFSELDAWSNKVKAVAFSKVANVNKDNNGVFSFAAPVKNNESAKPENVWERL